MAIVIGIDEAGYGPLVGPLVIACAALRTPDDGLACACLWERLHKGVVKRAGEVKKSGRLIVNDSKIVNSGQRGLRQLEAGVLAFAHVAQQDAPCLQTWLNALGQAPVAGWPDMPWYSDGAWDALPLRHTSDELAITQAMLQRVCDDAGVECLGLRAAVIPEATFNARMQVLHNKAALTFQHVAQHLHRAWRSFGREGVLAVVDRQGGRTHYRQVLSACFPDASMTVEGESSERSSYVLRGGGRTMRVVFQVKAEQDCMAVALASMVAKYTREALMLRLNAWWAQRVPDLKPTKGYGTDGKRWCKDVEPVLRKLGVSMQHVRRVAAGA